MWLIRLLGCKWATFRGVKEDLFRSKATKLGKLCRTQAWWTLSLKRFRTFIYLLIIWEILHDDIFLFFAYHLAQLLLVKSYQLLYVLPMLLRFTLCHRLPNNVTSRHHTFTRWYVDLWQRCFWCSQDLIFNMPLVEWNCTNHLNIRCSDFALFMWSKIALTIDRSSMRSWSATQIACTKEILIIFKILRFLFSHTDNIRSTTTDRRRFEHTFNIIVAWQYLR